MDSRDIASLHFIGIGGVGMSGIASVAHDQGIAVTGSDLKESRYTKQLREAGVTVFMPMLDASSQGEVQAALDGSVFTATLVKMNPLGGMFS